MFVSKGAKRTFVLFINKVLGPIERGDCGTQTANKPQVSGLEFDKLAQFNESGSTAAYDFLASCSHRKGVEIHGAGKVETTLDRSLNRY